MTKRFRIAVIPGDGIGPEVTEVGLDIVNRAFEKAGNYRLEFSTFPRKGMEDEIAIQLAIFTRNRTNQIIRYAFEIARKRQGQATGRPRPMVTNCTTKENQSHGSNLGWGHDGRIFERR